MSATTTRDQVTHTGTNESFILPDDVDATVLGLGNSVALGRDDTLVVMAASSPDAVTGSAPSASIVIGDKAAAIMDDQGSTISLQPDAYGLTVSNGATVIADKLGYSSVITVNGTGQTTIEGSSQFSVDIAVGSLASIEDPDASIAIIHVDGAYLVQGLVFGSSCSVHANARAIAGLEDEVVTYSGPAETGSAFGFVADFDDDTSEVPAPGPGYFECERDGPHRYHAL